MQGMILAAGMGKRLGSLTKDRTKSMVEVNGVSLMERMLEQLDKLGLSRIVIVIGFEGEKLKDFVNTLDVRTEIIFVENPVFDKTNNIYSLYLARKYLLKEDTLLMESDLIFREGVLEKLIAHPEKSVVLVDRFQSWMDGTCVTLGEGNRISRFVTKREFDFKEIGSYFKTVNIYKFDKAFSKHHYVPFLEAYCKAMGHNEYYEQVLKVVTLLEQPGICALPLEGEKWYEIDDCADLEIAESIFAEGDEKLRKIHRRYGGYWRYPEMVDFCYLVNPLFPPEKLKEEMKSVLDSLLTAYPSGRGTQDLLMAKLLGLEVEQVCTGNGAAELIPLLMESAPEPVGVLVPSFEEYRNRLKGKKITLMEVGSLGKNYKYSAADIMAFFKSNPIRSLVLVNPENPSGNYVDAEGMRALLEWSKREGICLILDESFFDFVGDSGKKTCLDPEILAEFDHLIVIKSISKAHGVPGVRLGFVASENRTVVNELKKSLPIWNINSFGEFYLQIFGKYEKEYEKALNEFEILRSELWKGLRKLRYIEPLSSQANFLMCRVKPPFTAASLSERLLKDHGILIKDLSEKEGISGQWIRMAVKTGLENQYLLRALEILTGNSENA